MILYILHDKGIFTNLTTPHSAFCVGYSDRKKKDGHNIINCTFEGLRSIFLLSPALYFVTPSTSTNVSGSVFRNISNNNSFIHAGSVYFMMTTDYNGHYNISNNTFYCISTNTSVLVLCGSFSSLSFSYNSFYNVSSATQGGVFILFSFIYLFY
jgi:hypothetical protein